MFSRQSHLCERFTGFIAGLRCSVGAPFLNEPKSVSSNAWRHCCKKSCAGDRLHRIEDEWWHARCVLRQGLGRPPASTMAQLQRRGACHSRPYRNEHAPRGTEVRGSSYRPICNPSNDAMQCSMGFFLELFEIRIDPLFRTFLHVACCPQRASVTRLVQRSTGALRSGHHHHMPIQRNNEYNSNNQFVSELMQKAVCARGRVQKDLDVFVELETFRARVSQNTTPQRGPNSLALRQKQGYSFIM
jgi:hypothetical protein